MKRDEELDRLVADAVLGVDTLWGGDVMSERGTERFIADCWFSDRSLPEAYTHPWAIALRTSGGVGAPEPDLRAVEAYLDVVDVPGAISGIAQQARRTGGLRGAYLEGLAGCFQVMWEMALEQLGRSEPVAYDRCVRAMTGEAPSPSDPTEKREKVTELLRRAGHPVRGEDGLLGAVDDWRRERLVPMKAIAAVAGAFVAKYDALAGRAIAPHLPPALGEVPRANIRFVPIADAWFSGSMNYLGRKRTPEGRPLYDATYEINASLQISVPEFEQLVSHEVVPGHVTTFAYLQDLWVRGEVGFEATVLTMNTRGAALFEGIANNALLMAHGAVEPEDLGDEALLLGYLLAQLQDDAKNQASYLTWGEGRPQAEVAATLRRDYLVTPERADKLSGAWGRHPLLGRMYLPAYRFGTEKVAELRRSHPAAELLPVLYGCRGLVDVVTIDAALAGRAQ